MPTDHCGAESRACAARAECPLQAVQNRLDDAHRLWHQALDAYCDPDGFRTYLNSCIQALRNVTFVLQKHKSRIPNFDTWYADWRTRMKSDSALQWLVAARNRVVKEGDLETASVARVSVVQGYLERAFLVTDLNPILSTDEIVADIASRPLPDELHAEGLLRIERRWIAQDRPAQELLGTLAHSYGVLNMLASDAHKQAGCKGTRIFIRDRDGSALPFRGETMHLQGRLPCMVVTEDRRTIWVELATHNIVSPSVAPILVPPETPEARRQLLERYDLAGTLASPPRKAKGLRELARYLFDVARRMLEVDGCHVPIVFLLFSDAQMEQHVLMPTTTSDKYLLWETLAQHVERSGANALVFISESWVTLQDPAHPEQPAGDSPERLEALGLTAASMDGDELELMQTFERRDGGIVLGQVEECTAVCTPFLEPVRMVWRRRSVQGCE